MTTSLLKLAERCEGLTGPDRETDALIAAVLRVGTDHEWALTNYPSWIAGDCGRVHLEKSGPSFTAPEFTASLDSAMTLVPEGKEFGCGSRDGTDRAWAWVGEAPALVYEDGSPLKMSNAATPALALCAASLRALAVEGGEG